MSASDRHTPFITGRGPPCMHCFLFEPILKPPVFLSPLCSQRGAAAYNANLNDVTIAGASAGGHLAALLLAYLGLRSPTN